MAKGKRGPKPERPEEIEERLNEPTAEEIVGAENIVDLSEDPPPQKGYICLGVGCQFSCDGLHEMEQHCADTGHGGNRTEAPAPVQKTGYLCSGDGCTYATDFLAEIEEHVAGTGHGTYKTVEQVQSELFSEAGIVYRMLDIPMPEELVNTKRARLAELYQSALEVKDEKKAIDDDCNARLKNIDTQMQEIARVLRVPTSHERVECEWRVLEGSNSRGLFRIDTGEKLEERPLTEEDRIRELEKANCENQAQAPAEVEEPVTVAE